MSNRSLSCCSFRISQKNFKLLKPGKSEKGSDSDTNAPDLKSWPALVKTPEKLYLRVNQRFLQTLDPPIASQLDPQSSPPLPDANGNLYVIIAALSEIQEFSGNSIDWLIQVANLIFDPLGSSSLYTFQTGTVEDWLEKSMDESWGLVAFGDQLKPTIYEFRSNRGVVSPTRISLRSHRSMGTERSQERARAFRTAVKQRQATCAISQVADMDLQIASHLVPRRLGDVCIQSIFRRFTGFPEPVVQSVDGYHHLTGIALSVVLDHLVAIYNVGFWKIGPDQYEIHNFTNRDLNIYGTPPFSEDEPRLHRRHIALARNNQSIDNPPIGVFNWHYVQCVLKRFATPEYANLPNIHHFNLPLHTREDAGWSDSESDGPDNAL